ncbi:helicase associated domain-containing protein [Streptomyces sclerotialus]|uniref:helicase associated domain-containing protein n=1 Tax=Streptomyces sclerotialus TaxID=1957 RepID=UPI0004CA0C6E
MALDLRRPGTLDGHPERAAALAAIDPDWNPAWPIDWQRHYAAVRECLTGGAAVADLLPGDTVDGADVGRWLARQRERLEQLGIAPLPAPEKTPAKGRRSGSGAFERGVAGPLCAVQGPYRLCGARQPLSR